jgi:hypothetical protein
MTERHTHVLITALHDDKNNNNNNNSNLVLSRDDRDALLGTLTNLSLDDKLAARLCEGGAVFESMVKIMSESMCMYVFVCVCVCVCVCVVYMQHLCV